MLNIFGFFDRSKIATLKQSPEIKALAKHWRECLANAKVDSIYTPPFGAIVASPYTEAELDLFEVGLAECLAKSCVYVSGPNNLFTERGLETSMTAWSVLFELKLDRKLIYMGYFTRMRILFGREVAHEAPPYLSQNWQTIWRPDALC